jgi:hypothetical protein
MDAKKRLSFPVSFFFFLVKKIGNSLFFAGLNEREIELIKKILKKIKKEKSSKIL